MGVCVRARVCACVRVHLLACTLPQGRNEAQVKVCQEARFRKMLGDSELRMWRSCLDED